VQAVLHSPLYLHNVVRGRGNVVCTCVRTLHGQLGTGGLEKAELRPVRIYCAGTCLE
jgi:hypothetical protein